LGLSWQALASAALFIGGLFVIRRRDLFGRWLVPVYLMIGVITASGIVNGAFSGAAANIIKYGYLAVLMIAVCDAAEDIGADRLLKLIAWTFLLPFGLQALSVVLGISKSGGADGSISYVGGFFHESAFSTTLVAGVLAVALIRRISLPVRFVLILWGFAAVMLANYRTSILAMMPLLAALVLTDVPRRFVAQQRLFIGGALTLLLAAATMLLLVAGEDRFSDVWTALQQDDLIRPPGDFTTEERRIMSARPYIWSLYYYGWAEGTLLQRLLGFGPESWETAFRLYAHNQLFSSLYEYGLAGVVAISVLWIRMFAMGLALPDEHRILISAAHLGFGLLAMATMPLWQIEGMIFYGILCGITLYRFRQARNAAALVAASPRQSSAAASAS
jgi:hypothetical protein